MEDLATWAIGLGAMSIAFSLVLGSEPAHDNLIVRSTLNERADRSWFALAVADAALVAAGSVMLAVQNHPGLAELAITAGGLVLFHLVSAWKLRDLLMDRRNGAVRTVAAPGTPDPERAVWQAWAIALTK